MNNIICNKCDASFALLIEKETVRNDIQHHFIECPHCDEKYTSYYSNKFIRKQQLLIQKEWKRFRSAKNVEEATKVEEKINKLKKEMSEAMAELKNKIN